jgi:hypothetical protein
LPLSGKLTQEEPFALLEMQVEISDSVIGSSAKLAIPDSRNGASSGPGL